jgi:hypothetical protein
LEIRRYGFQARRWLLFLALMSSACAVTSKSG